MKIKIVLSTFSLLLLFLPSFTFAHPGRTDSSGCHTCKTNCPSWGLSYGQYHCHNGGSIPAPTVEQEQPIYIPPTKYILPPTLKPTNTPSPTITPTPKPTEIIKKKITKNVKKTSQKKTFWQWLFGK